MPRRLDRSIPSCLHIGHCISGLPSAFGAQLEDTCSNAVVKNGFTRRMSFCQEETGAGHEADSSMPPLATETEWSLTTGKHKHSARNRATIAGPQRFLRHGRHSAEICKQVQTPEKPKARTPFGIRAFAHTGVAAYYSTSRVIWKLGCEQGASAGLPALVVGSMPHAWVTGGLTIGET